MNPSNWERAIHAELVHTAKMARENNHELLHPGNCPCDKNSEKSCLVCDFNIPTCRKCGRSSFETHCER